MIFNKIIINTFIFNKRIMIANFHNSTTVEYNNLIGIFYRGQAMSYNHNSPSLIEIIKVFNDSSLIFRVKSISRFIKKNEIWVLIDCAGYKNTLFLSLTQSYAILTYLSIIF